MGLRIIAGEKRGAALRAPRGLATRPTLGRVRESLFMILMPRLPGAVVLDGFAGCGALGLEALSRGAAHVTFIEQDGPALEALRANIAKLGWDDRARIVDREALAVLRRPDPPGLPGSRPGAPGGRPFDLILLDPPYGCGLCARALEQLAERARNWIAVEGIVVGQFGRHDPMETAYGPLAEYRREAYGETRIAFYRLGRTEVAP